jgi:hypothetical protein
MHDCPQDLSLTPTAVHCAQLQKTVPAAALRITLTPKWFTDEEESGMTRFEFGGECPIPSSFQGCPSVRSTTTVSAQTHGLSVGRLCASQRLDVAPG